MTPIAETIQAFAQIGQLSNAMGWDEKHGPTEEQWDDFMVLFPDVDTVNKLRQRGVPGYHFDLQTLTLHPVL